MGFFAIYPDIRAGTSELFGCHQKVKELTSVREFLEKSREKGNDALLKTSITASVCGNDAGDAFFSWRHRSGMLIL